MKSHTIEWNAIETPRATSKPAATIGRLDRGLFIAARGFAAAVAALALVVGAAWLASTPALAIYLQATLWASGFLFLGLALDGEPPFRGLLVITGLALPALALMSANVAIEIAIIGAAVAALWIAAGILRR